MANKLPKGCSLLIECQCLLILGAEILHGTCQARLQLVLWMMIPIRITFVNVYVPFSSPPGNRRGIYEIVIWIEHQIFRNGLVYNSLGSSSRSCWGEGEEISIDELVTNKQHSHLCWTLLSALYHTKLCDYAAFNGTTALLQG